jgi:hypothetical protein
MKVYIVSVRQVLSADAHNAEIAEKIATILAGASKQATADKGRNYIVLDVWPPYSESNSERWANHCVKLINELDYRKVQAEVLQAEIRKPS